MVEALQLPVQEPTSVNEITPEHPSRTAFTMFVMRMQYVSRSGAISLTVLVIDEAIVDRKHQHHQKEKEQQSPLSPSSLSLSPLFDFLHYMIFLR